MNLALHASSLGSFRAFKFFFRCSLYNGHLVLIWTGLFESNYKPLSDLVSFIRSEWILLQTSFFIWWISKCGLSRVYQPVVVYLYPPCCASPSSCSWWCICIHGQTSYPSSSFTVVYLYPWRLNLNLSINYPFIPFPAAPIKHYLSSIPNVTHSASFCDVSLVFG